MKRNNTKSQKSLCLKGMALLLFVFGLILFTGAHSRCYSQDNRDRDSLIRLLDARTVRLEENANGVFRKVEGPATFLHNNTYLKCDSAIWSVNEDVIEALGNVQIIQQDTYLVGDKLTYYTQDNLAQFRGTVVRLYNRKGDQLKTRYLDYNTRDSVATFYNGGAMRSANGDIIESNNGSYESGPGIFSFSGRVDMHSDSLFVSSDRVQYDSKEEKAYFFERTTAYKEQDTLFTDSGEYSRLYNILRIKRNNYIATEENEMWGRVISYFRNTGNADLFADVQIRNNAQSSILVGEIGIYKSNPTKAFLTDHAGAAMYSEERTGVDSLTNEPVFKRDTLFLSGDTLMLRMIPKCEIDSSVIAMAEERKMLADRDPMVQINERNEAFLAAYKRNKENAGKIPPPAKAVKPSDGEDSIGSENSENEEKADDENDEGNEVDVESKEMGRLRDSLMMQMPDSLIVAQTDSLEIQKDTTKIAFIDIHHNVRMFKSDLRGACDSLVYTSIDSIARFYVDPVFWDGDKSQFTADSIQLSVRNNAIYKANLIENAFIISQEDSVHFNQIKSSEMVAYFKDNNVYRFDAIGGANVMAFIKERDSVVTLMNQKECKLLSARMKNKAIQRIKYIENLKSDVRPTYKMPLEMMRLRNFNWRMDEMPVNRYQVVSTEIRPSERGRLSKERYPSFLQTKTYFPESYVAIKTLSDDINKKINAARESKKIQSSEPKYIEQEGSEPRSEK